MNKTGNTSYVKEYIKRYIFENKLKPGDMLPPEGQIAKDLDIGRNSVKEATRSLESIGILEIKHGVGLVVRSFNLDAIVDIFSYGFALDKDLIYDLYDIRKQIETSLIPKVIENIDDISISKCNLILAEWGYSIQKGQYVHDIDREFHDVLYRPVGNNLLIGLCDIFWNALKQAELTGLIYKNPSNKETELKILQEHKEILDAVIAKDVSKAQDLMLKHFKDLYLAE